MSNLSYVVGNKPQQQQPASKDNNLHTHNSSSTQGRLLQFSSDSANNIINTQSVGIYFAVRLFQ